MQHMLIELMIENGSVKRESDASFFGRKSPSRGFYIVDPSGRWYLHHDGNVKDGVNSNSDKPAFWPTEEIATIFFEDWKASLSRNT